MRRVSFFVRCLTALAAIGVVASCSDAPTGPTRQEGPSLATASNGSGLSITTDKDDYAPGDTVWFTGAGWTPGDTLDIVLTDSVDVHNWSVGIDENGGFRDSTYVVDVNDLGVTFTLTATSRTNPEQTLTVTFTDGNIRIFSKYPGIRFVLTGTPYTGSTTCAGTAGTQSNDTVGSTVGTSKTYGRTATESVLLEAAAKSVSGGAFQSWDPSTASAPWTAGANSRTICAPGFTGGGNRDYFAKYDSVPDLKITKAHTPTAFTDGSSGTYTLTVENVGQKQTNGTTVTVKDTLPTGLDFASFIGTDAAWSCLNALNIVTCTRSNALNAGSSYGVISINVTVKPAAVGTATNRAHVSGGGDVSDEPGGNNHATDVVTVNGIVDLSIDKSHTGDFTRGQNATYSLLVTNNGSAATDAAIVVTDTLPSGLGFVSGTGTDWNNCTASGQVVTCTRPNTNPIAANSSAPAISLTVSVGSSTANSITNRAHVKGGKEDAAQENQNCALDPADNCDSDPTNVVDSNHPPTANAGPDQTGNEGSAIQFDGHLSSDPDAEDVIHYLWTVDFTTTSGDYKAIDNTVGHVGSCSFVDPDDATNARPDTLAKPYITCTDDSNGGKFKVTLTVTDSHGASDDDTADLTVNNVAPTITAVNVTPFVSGYIYPISSQPTVGATYTDPGSNDILTCKFEVFNYLNQEVGLDRTCGAGLGVTEAGVYDVKVTVTDDDGGSDDETVQIVIYDPSAGFVTGGGWIYSAAGAYKDDVTLYGKGTFGFVSKYQKGASVPTGNTQFVFHAENAMGNALDFHSTSYDWLVVNGAGSRAQYKGAGLIEGRSDTFTFMLTAVDGSTDRFRIQIFRPDGSTLYDNYLGGNVTEEALGGGSIVIHTK